ncbi:MAG: alpha/beta hydrolase [Bacteroidota bacterium]
MKKTSYKNINVVYTDHGQGPCVVLLHGYLETSRIWEDFVQKFPEGIRLISIDLPGHGASGTWGPSHQMDDLAASVLAVLEAEQVEKVFLAGHSMGGYVTMAFVELFPERLLAYSLVHSTCYADTEEKKKNRDREISLVRCGKKGQIINVNIPKGFATDNVDRMSGEVERVRQIAQSNPDEGVVAILNGMKERPDRSHVLKDPSLPLLLIGGMKDNYIPVEVFEQLVLMAPHASVLKLGNSGHMGFIEEADKVVRAMVEMLF